MRGILILLVMAIGGPFLAWSGYNYKQFRAKLAADGVTVQALAHGGEIREGKNSSAKLEVSYDVDGRQIHKEMPVSTSFMKSISNDTSLTVDTVQVTYLKSDPEQAIIVGGTPDTSFNLWLGIIVSAIGWVGGGLYLKNIAGENFGGSEEAPRRKSTTKKKKGPVSMDDDE